MNIKLLHMTFFLLLSVCSDASVNKDLDGDGNPDTLTINIAGEDAVVAIESSRTKSTRKFSMSLVGSCGVFTIYSADENGAIFVDQSCSGRQAQMSKELYVWNEPFDSWVLQKTIQGEAIDQVGGILPSLTIQRAECCLIIEKNNEQIKMKTEGQSAAEINRQLEQIAKTFKDSNLLTEALKKWTLEMSVELAAAIVDKNIGTANDLAYYLWRQSRFIDSAIILEKIVLKDPDRTVALLNFADSLWGLDTEAFKEKAKDYYKRYDGKMRAANKDKLIPARVVERIKNF